MSDAHSRRTETHDRITQAAHELFAANGYDAVSVATIAESAGVTERTVFRHFPEKYRLAYPEAEQHLAALLDELRERSREGRVNHEVLGGAVVALFSRIVRAGEAERMALRGRMVGASDDLRGRIYGMFSSWRHALTDELRPHLGDDEEAARIAAAAVATMIIDTGRRWLIEDAEPALDEVARQVADKHRDAYTDLLAG